jgi:predicted dehydrogenase
MNTWLIGAGAMAQDYFKVLVSQGVNFEVVGRSIDGAKSFETITGKPVQVGGLVKALNANSAPDCALVAVGVESLADTALKLIHAGTKRILLEKPGGLNTLQIQAVADAALKNKTEVLIAYNRRFFASTAFARTLIAEDGGATTCNFEFTEWSQIISPMLKGAEVKAAWFLANSTHVVDLAFHLCGFPKDWHFWHGGSLDWHPTASRFCGSGITDQEVLFSYHADWEAPGRWGLEVLTPKHRLIFRPMEQLQMIKLGSVKVESVELDDKLDKAYKPGLFMQTKAFLDGDDRLFCTIDEQLRNGAVYDEMAGYDPVASNSQLFSPSILL